MNMFANMSIYTTSGVDGHVCPCSLVTVVSIYMFATVH